MNDTRETYKVCTKCSENKPLTEYHRNKTLKDGYRNECKPCVRKYREAYNSANKDKIRARDKAYYAANRDARIEYQRKYHAENREAQNATNRAWYRANRESAIAYSKARYEANREEELRYRREHYAANREAAIKKSREYYWINRDEILAKKKVSRAERWATDPAFRSLYYAGNLRRKRLLEGVKQETYVREEIFERDGWECQLCGGPIDKNLRFPDSGVVSIDHIVPLSLGGDDTPANVQTAHLGCNVGKGNRVDLDQPA